MGFGEATIIMMWPCGWDGQKQDPNFGQTLGQRQTRHTQHEKMVIVKYGFAFTSSEAFMHGRGN